MKYCKDIGWEAVGYDICEELVSRAKKMFDVDIFTSIEVLKKKGKFDVIFLGDTLEHLVNPNKTISIFREMLSSSGMIVIFTPTYLNSINYFILNKIYHFLVEKIKLTSKRNLNFERLGRFNLNNASLPPYHIYEFSPKSICFLLRRNGFKIVAVKYTVPIPYSLNRESNIGKVINFILRMAKFTAENFYFPRIKTLVIATKHGE